MSACLYPLSQGGDSSCILSSHRNTHHTITVAMPGQRVGWVPWWEDRGVNAFTGNGWGLMVSDPSGG